MLSRVKMSLILNCYFFLIDPIRKEVNGVHSVRPLCCVPLHYVPFISSHAHFVPFTAFPFILSQTHLAPQSICPIHFVPCPFVPNSFCPLTFGPKLILSHTLCFCKIYPYLFLHNRLTLTKDNMKKRNSHTEISFTT
jgi:hypothetical protein